MAKDSDILKEAQDWLEEAQAAESENRTNALDDIKFARLGEQWPDQIRQDRELEGRPCLTINKLPAFARQVINDARQNRPQIDVKPVDDQADPITAKIMSGLIRNIQVASDADVAYDTAVEAAVYGGFGYFRVDIDYAHNDAFDKDIRIGRILNPFSVFGDPWSQAADSSDWTRAVVTELLKRPEFEAKYPGAKAVSADFIATGVKDWISDDSVRVAEWWKREEVDRPLVQLTDGQIMTAETYLQNKPLFDVSGIGVRGERESKGYKVVQRLITGAEVLSKTEWAGCWIPIVPVYGDEVCVEGKRYFRSLIRDAKDPQRMFNYWRTNATELVALAPRVPFIGPVGSFNTDAEKWATANRKNHSHIEYDGPVSPQRQSLDTGAAAGSLQEALNASDDMKAIMGIYDASLGARSNETSGKAIIARQRESDVGTFHFVDNLSRAIRHAGRILVDLVPKVYTGERIIRVLGEDLAPQSVKLGQPIQFEGQQRLLDLAIGKYDVVVKAGPSYSTKREEAADQMMMFVQANPNAAPLIGGMIAKNLDWPDADKVAARLDAALPPHLRGEGPPPEVQQMQAQMQQMGQQMQQTAQENQMLKADKTAEIQTKQIESSIKTQELEFKREELDYKRQELELKRLELAARSQEVQINAQVEAQKSANEQAANVGQQIVLPLQELVKSIGEMNAQPKGSRVKRGRAVRQPDGSYLMESVEDEPTLQ